MNKYVKSVVILDKEDNYRNVERVFIAPKDLDEKEIEVCIEEFKKEVRESNNFENYWLRLSSLLTDKFGLKEVPFNDIYMNDIGYHPEDNEEDIVITEKHFDSLKDVKIITVQDLECRDIKGSFIAPKCLSRDVIFDYIEKCNDNCDGYLDKALILTANHFDLEEILFCEFYA